MTPTFDQTVADLVIDHPECARVFQAHAIDYCCRGGVSITEAASSRGLDPAVLATELETAIREREGEPPRDFRAMSVAELVAHIVGTHHRFLRQTLPSLLPLAAKVARVHGDHEPRLLEIEALASELVRALVPHLEQEERVLFPLLMSATSGDDARQRLAEELEQMHEDHLEVGALLEQLRRASDGYTPPGWGCTSYRTLFAELAAIEADTLRHVHLENHVLAKRVTA